LPVHHREVYVGGRFGHGGSGGGNHRDGKMDRFGLSAVGTTGSASAVVSALGVYCGDLYAGGSFTTINGQSINYLARWDGTTWSALGSATALNNAVNALAAYNGSLYVGGWFTTAGGVAGADRIAKWSGSCFYTVGTEEGPNAPSLVRFTKAHALAYDGVQNRVVHLQWRTSYEVDHLGFHVYREQNGQRLQVTPALIAGSALKARP